MTTTRGRDAIAPPVKVMIVEDEGLYRDLLRVSLTSRHGLDVVAAVGDGATAIRTAREIKPDVIIMDIELGSEPNGIEAGLTIKKENARVGIVVLSLYADKEYLSLVPMEHAGGWSYLMKQSTADLDALTRAIEGSAKGLLVLDPALVLGLRPRPKTRLEGLTARQREVLELIAQGYSNAGVAERLHLGVKSVENYINTIYQQLGIGQNEPIHARVKAVLIYLQESRSRPAAPRPSA